MSTTIKITPVIGTKAVLSERRAGLVRYFILPSLSVREHQFQLKLVVARLVQAEAKTYPWCFLRSILGALHVSLILLHWLESFKLKISWPVFCSEIKGFAVNLESVKNRDLWDIKPHLGCKAAFPKICEHRDHWLLSVKENPELLKNVCLDLVVVLYVADDWRRIKMDSGAKLTSNILVAWMRVQPIWASEIGHWVGCWISPQHEIFEVCFLTLREQVVARPIPSLRVDLRIRIKRSTGINVVRIVLWIVGLSQPPAGDVQRKIDHNKDLNWRCDRGALPLDEVFSH